jgi:hypothetical protein
MDVLNKIKNLKTDVVKSPDYNTTATAKVRKLVDEIISGLIKLQGRTVGGNPFNNVLGNMMGSSGSNSMFVKSRNSIIADINDIKREVINTRDINTQLTQYVNSKLEEIKRY